jgi:hypothetical protein
MSLALTGDSSNAQLAQAPRTPSLAVPAVQYIQQGLPSDGDPELEPYPSRRLELSSYEGCVMWGRRAVIPPPGREAVL